MAIFPGPPELGRGVVLLPGQPVPEPCAAWEVVAVGAAAAEDPSPVADRLQAAWLERRPVVVVLGADPVALRRPERCERPVYELRASFELGRERLQYLVWSNNFDCRAGEPVWWHARRALRLGAVESAHADVGLPGSGRPAWCDGGPRRPIEVSGGAAVVHRDAIEAGSLAVEVARPVAAELAPDQLAAVSHPAGPARVIAPAGSGKTRVLSERLRHLLADRRLPPGDVLAVAFNRRAADELSERVAGLGAHVRTLNSLGLAVLNGSKPFAATAAPRQVIDESDVRRIVEGLVKLPRRANADPVVPYLDALSLIRLGLVAPSVAEDLIPDADGVAEIFDDYRSILAERGVVDFDEQIYGAIELLLGDPELRRQDQQRARHLLVDEFQDLTPAHLLLLRLLAAPGLDVFGVGDDDQVIYSYAGASPEFLVHYGRYFPGAAEYTLEINYRCPPAVITAVGNLLSFNTDRVAKVVSPPPGGGGAPPGDGSPPAAAAAPATGPDDGDGGALQVRLRPAAEHATGALDRIRSWLEGGSRPDEIAVLARVAAALLPIQVVLAEAGVPSTAPLGEEVLARTGIRAALAYLRAASEPERISRRDAGETIRRPSRRIAPNVVEMVLKRQWTGVSDLRRLAGVLSGRDVERLLEYAGDIETLGRVAVAGSTRQVLEAIRTTVGLGGAMETLDSSRREADRSTHLDDLRALEQLAGLHPEPASFETWLRGVLASGGTRSSAPAGGGVTAGVTLSTVHRVKGREWAHVIVIGADAEQFPHRLASDLEEERRVFHVALTRCATDVLVLADSAAPSPFCEELRAASVPGASRAGDLARASRQAERGAPRVGTARVAAGGKPGAGPVVTAGGESDSEGGGKGFEALRSWRSATAAAEHVPAYVVFSDAHLRGIVDAAPSTLGELARCAGVGPVKLERYGEQVLDVLEGVRGRLAAGP